MSDHRPISGRLVPTAEGRDLVLTRTHRADIEDVWASITEPERTARWIGPWTGECAVGAKVTLVMAFEEGQPAGDLVIEACDAPRRLAVRMVDEHVDWRLEARLGQQGDITTMELIHHLDPDVSPSDVGPGWEFYLDLLEAARAGDDPVTFDGYQDGFGPAYRALEP